VIGRVRAAHDEEERDERRQHGEAERLAEEGEDEPQLRDPQGRLAEDVFGLHLPRVAGLAVVAPEDVAGAGVAGDDPVDDERPAPFLDRRAVGHDRAAAIGGAATRDDEVAALVGGQHAVARDDHLVPRDAGEARLQRQGSGEGEQPERQGERRPARHRADRRELRHCG
jgi:hypothetical protein